jgi:hypothetical protein
MFFSAESSQGVAVERIIELVTHKEIYPEILLQVHFIYENCSRVIYSLTQLEASKLPIVVIAYNIIADL